MKKVFCFLRIENGQILNKEAVRKMFNELKDGRYKLEASQRNNRSTNQNDYYWLILTDYIQPALYDLGWQEVKTKEDAHEFCKEMFLKVTEINHQTGEERKRIKSTTELSTVEFGVYLEEIWQWAAAYLSISIPSPNESLKLDLV